MRLPRKAGNSQNSSSSSDGFDFDEEENIINNEDLVMEAVSLCNIAHKEVSEQESGAEAGDL